MQKIHNKLVRNKIPQAIKENQQIPIVRKLDDNDFVNELLRKLEEEIQEVIGARNDKEELTKEIGDVYEVIDAIIDLYKLDKNLILELQKKKKQERGGFEEKIYLESVEE
ncbi:MAG: nucleoside triphosphate pyrophosphohydrolase [Patescibacteria group bacterium]|nr:nucleoside triphosphate pyrophosphohydrolase [Patescibacteria group bacterium]